MKLNFNEAFNAATDLRLVALPNAIMHRASNGNLTGLHTVPMTKLSSDVDTCPKLTLTSDTQ